MMPARAGAAGDHPKFGPQWSLPGSPVSVKRHEKPFIYNDLLSKRTFVSSSGDTTKAGRSSLFNASN
jgi:hypothetical protein